MHEIYREKINKIVPVPSLILVIVRKIRGRKQKVLVNLPNTFTKQITVGLSFGFDR